MADNPFVTQGKAIPNQARGGWMTQQIKAGRKRFEHSKKHRWRCHQQFCWTSTRLARTEDVVTYTEFCKQQQPSLSAEEIQPVVAIYDGLSNKITPTIVGPEMFLDIVDTHSE